MAKTRIGSNAQFTSLGSLQIAKECAYAYGEIKDIADTNEHVLLRFQTGKYLIKGNAVFVRKSWEDNDIRWYVKFNGIEVISWIGRVAEPQGTNVQPLIIPPLTDVVFYADKQQHSADSKISANFTGYIK